MYIIYRLKAIEPFIKQTFTFNDTLEIFHSRNRTKSLDTSEFSKAIIYNMRELIMK